MVSVAPLLPLLSRHTSVETPSEPDVSTASLWNELEFWPMALMIGAGLVKLLLGQLRLADEGVQVLDQRRHHLAEARIGRALDLAQHRPVT